MMSDTPPKADVVFRGGTVLTLDGTGATHEAIATQGDRILSVGANTSIDPLIGRRTQVIELDGLTCNFLASMMPTLTWSARV